MHIALNAWSLLSPHTGIASYTKNLALAMSQHDDVALRYFYGYNWSEDLREASVPGMDAVKSWVKRLVPSHYSLMRYMQQRRFSQGVCNPRCDLYHEPSFLPFAFDGPTVITIHDLSPLRFPSMHPASRVREFFEKLPKAIDRAATIIVDAESVRQEVITTFGVSSERIRAIHLGVSDVYKPRNASALAPILARYQLTASRYLLAVGTLEPRKNLIQAVNAFAGLPEKLRASSPLVIAGMRGWLTQDLENRIRQLEERGEVRWLGYVPAEELPHLYSGAAMLIYPSLYEGFGLPVLEAMASGIPVITSNRASLPEVMGDAGVMIDPEDTPGLREHIRRLLEDPAEAARLGQRGVERARLFTWEACAEKTLTVYRAAINRHGEGASK
jgi:alpha-1,3-rhamnosyl/mannosyltransferase